MSFYEIYKKSRELRFYLGVLQLLVTLVISPKLAFANLVYVANYDNNNLSVIDTNTNAVVATVNSGGSNPLGVAITPDGRFIYVSNQNSNTVSVINTADNTIVTIIPVGSKPYGIAITPNGKFAYVTNTASNTVSVIRTGDDHGLQKKMQHVARGLLTAGKN